MTDFNSSLMLFLIMTHDIILFHYRNVPRMKETTLPALSVVKYLLLKPLLKILHLSPSFHFFNAMLQILVTTQIYVQNIHDPFTFMQKIPLNEGLLPYIYIYILEYSELFRKNVVLTFSWSSFSVCDKSHLRLKKSYLFLYF